MRFVHQRKQTAIRIYSRCPGNNMSIAQDAAGCSPQGSPSGCAFFVEKLKGSSQVAAFRPQKEGMMLAPGLGRGISLTALTALFLLFSPLLNYQVAFAQFPIANPGTEGLEVMVSGTAHVQGERLNHTIFAREARPSMR
jgi:hypothetical protein